MLGPGRSLHGVSATLRLDSNQITVGRRLVAIIRCVEARLDRNELSNLLDRLAAATTHVCLANVATGEAEIRALAGEDAPCATARPVTDALKEVADGRIVATFDRNRLYRAGLPMLIETGALNARLRTLVAVDLAPGALLDPDGAVTFLAVKGA